MTYDFSIDPELYRKARNRVKSGKLGVCPFKVGRKIGFILLHKTLTKFQRVCYDFSIPLDYIRTDKKLRYGFHYIILFGTASQRWKSVMRGDIMSSDGRGWRAY